MSRLDAFREANRARLAQQGQGANQETGNGDENAGNGEGNPVSPPAPEQAPKRERVAYQAFGAPTSDEQKRLIIYTAHIFLMPRYDLLYDVVFSGRYDFVGLVFPHQRIRLFGQNLADLVMGLRDNRIEWLREFNPALQYLPGDASERETLAVITEIHIDGAGHIFEEVKPKAETAEAEPA